MSTVKRKILVLSGKGGVGKSTFTAQLGWAFAADEQLQVSSSLRRLRRDNGWIHTLFEEAENERMHLLTYLELKKPGKAFKFLVWMLQGIFFNFYFFAYIVSPVFCHRLVGYLEEQAVKTYTKVLEEIDNPDGALKEWRNTPAPEIAKVDHHLKMRLT